MSRRHLIVLALPAAMLIVACGSSQATSQSSTARAATWPVSSPSSPLSSSPSSSSPSTTSPAEATSTPAASGPLSGTWSGQYGGSYQGTFTLTWQQTGSNLRGTIKLSKPASRLSINGTLQGTAISFGTVGSVAITYSGSVSGNSMSGTYEVAGSGGGSWSAWQTS